MLDDAARTQLIDGRRIVVRRFDSATPAGGCHIAFVAPSGGQLPSVAAQAVLTVTDSSNGGPKGIINFVIAGGRVRFIDQRSAAQRGLSISSRLLALAVGVRE